MAIPLQGLRLPDPALENPTKARSPAASASGRLVLLSMCAAVVAHTVQGGWDPVSDGADGLPIIAAMSIAASVLMWAPRNGEPSVRQVTTMTSFVLLLVAVHLFYLGHQYTGLGRHLFGPMVTASLLAAYLSCWGFRSLFLLRRVAVISLLCWSVIADRVHRAVRVSIEQPSDLIYRRLATLPWFGIEDQQWRLFGAMMHRGALTAIGATMLWFATTRLRLTVSFIGRLTAIVTASLVVHHIIVLAMPVDRYDLSSVARVALGPDAEVLVAGATVLLLVAVRRGRVPAVTGKAPNLMDRDPVIFGGADKAGTVWAMRTIATMVPLGLVIAMGFG